MPSFTQEHQAIAIDTPLGKDVLLLQSISGSESISRLFRFTLTMLSEQPAISFGDIVGQRVTLSIRQRSGEPRYINGFISRFAQTGADKRFIYYQAEVVPWLWFLTRNSDSRIFQNKSPIDIIKAVFDERGFSAFSDRTQTTLPTREYCVQYRESDFNFVSRLMEQYGIFYYFEHDQHSHTLVMADSLSVHRPCPGQSRVSWIESPGTFEEDVITGWRIEQELRPGKYALQDYNFETPSTSLMTNIDSTVTIDNNNNYEVYDYPGGYPNTSEGNELVKLRIQAEEAISTIATGSGSCRSFIAGYLFDLADHYRRDLNKSYILVEVQHDATVGDSYVSGDASVASYTNHFTAIPANTTFRPQRMTSQSLVQGPQTAVVVGPQGSEIYVDNYSRVKVQFFWDRQGRNDDQSSCWIRVSQPWAGKQWGFIAIPRIGQEVIVDFLEGNPDRPIITGRVYNSEQMPPYALPDNQTQTGIKSRSSQGGGPANFNELRFEDKKAQEEFYAHAERNLTTEVENDESRTVGHDRTTTIRHDETLNVQNNRIATVAMSDDATAGTSMSLTSGTSFSITAGASIEVTAGASLTITAGGVISIVAPMVSIEAAMVQIAGVMQATSVVSPTYSPGVGNII
jgi:type VI secretion system secreted protein VgrG